MIALGSHSIDSRAGLTQLLTLDISAASHVAQQGGMGQEAILCFMPSGSSSAAQRHTLPNQARQGIFHFLFKAPFHGKLYSGPYLLSPGLLPGWMQCFLGPGSVTWGSLATEGGPAA